eukprot:15389657-Alexandrium_andersonii.AAC.1
MGESALTGQLGAPLRGRPTLQCESIFAHSAAPAGRCPREGSEGPLWRGARLPPGRLGPRQAARVTTYPESLRISQLP